MEISRLLKCSCPSPPKLLATTYPVPPAFFGSAAQTFVDELESDRRLPPHAEQVWEATQKEIHEGTAGPLLTRADMDSHFGVGQWRPLPRHVVWQTEKWRPIDDGKRAHTNALTTMHETIVCIPPEFAPLTIRSLACALHDTLGDIPSWFQPVLSTEDWWKGYRQIFPVSAHMGLAVVAVMHPRSRQWHYSQLKGLPFGLASSVNQFSRVAAFVTAVNRRLLYSLCGNYVDDMALLEMFPIAHCSSSASACAGALADLMGVRYSPDKSQPPAFMVTFLGHLHDLCRTPWSGNVVWGPRLSTREKVADIIDHALASKHLSSGEAAKLRGLCTWLDSSLSGRALRGAMYALTARQYWDHSTLIEPGSTLHICLQCLKAATLAIPDRSLSLLKPT